MKEEVLRMERVTRVVDGVTRLDNLNLHIFKGEIMGLLALHDHGMKDLVELISQNLPLHYGYVYFNEKLVNSYQKRSQTLNRVSVIEKRSRLVEDLTVADNIFVLRRGFKKFFVQPRKLKSQLMQFTGSLDIHIDFDQHASALSNYERCVVELLKAVVTGTRLVVIRNISNSVSAADLTRFQRLLKHYAAQGFSFLYICSHHEEAVTVCDRIAMMSDGRILITTEKPFLNDEVFWHHALDFGIAASAPKECRKSAPLLEFRQVYAESVKGLSFSVWPGECVTILDRSNTILQDMVMLLNREITPDSGRIMMNGLPFEKNRNLREQSVGFIQEDPVHTMLYPEMSCLDNLCILTDEKQPHIWRSGALRRNVAQEYRQYLGGDIFERDIRNLSHRAQYSLVYYRIHMYRPAVAVCVQPFFGADMYLRHHIITLINELIKKKISVVLLSVNISDSLSISDRLLIVEDGRLINEYSRPDFKKLSKQEGYDPHRSCQPQFSGKG